MEDITHLIGHVLEHSVEDTLYLIPFLFVTYLAMEWLEHKAGDKAEEAVRRAGVAGRGRRACGHRPAMWLGGGCNAVGGPRHHAWHAVRGVPVTSDEMLPIFLAEQVAPMTILKIMGVKPTIGVVDARLSAWRARHRERLRIHELCERDRCHCNSDCGRCGAAAGAGVRLRAR